MESCCLKKEKNFSFEDIECNECFCPASLIDPYELLVKILSSPTENLEYELICMNALRRMADIYLKRTVQTFCVCKNLAKFLEVFINDDIWHKTLDYFKRKEDKYLQFVVIKLLAVVMHTFPVQVFKLRLEILVKSLLQNAEKENHMHYLDLFAKLIEYNSSANANENKDNCKCKCTVPGTIISSKDILGILSCELSQNWDRFLDIFLRTKHQNVISFLVLWKILCEKNLGSDFFSTVVNEKYGLEFLSLSSKIPPKGFKLYVDIIFLIFYSKLKGDSLNYTGEEIFEEVVINAISEGFCHLLPTENKICTFCSSVSGTPNLLGESNIKSDVISKKVIFIIFSLLGEFQNSVLLCKALEKVFDYLSMPSYNWKPQTTHIWITDTFIDEDDILLGVMLAFVRIYCNLKKESVLRSDGGLAANMIQNELNPHKIFLKFLQQIECEIFFQAHEIFVEAKDMLLLSPTDNSKLVTDASNYAGSNQRLVTYSSSSSSDEEYLNVEQNNIISSENKFVFRTMSVLSNLRKGIQKLVHVNEFPYNVSPLMSLLKACEEKCISFT
ncbi:hypothetical protein CDAR_197231 [Caerostris darwini]|uniref:Uncharacterized protein n=1 Tax=Caerostris darwini TaxID=1538125 RepID=A0AAV4M7P0_9ARAC|nr:hypothetical protein CDAR_197231 [Caerostris darwini]